MAHKYDVVDIFGSSIRILQSVKFIQGTNEEIWAKQTIIPLSSRVLMLIIKYFHIWLFSFFEMMRWEEKFQTTTNTINQYYLKYYKSGNPENSV